ncbi:MAG: hypothetical protein JXR53_14415 [Bacteroidales bacterium]|nr:hypothetical protein [Bacteroidales bacterium]
MLSTILLWAKLFSIEQIRYENEFPISFSAALSYISSHPDANIRLKHKGIDSCLSWSIVFSELIRYDTIQDYFEVSALKTLYIQYGKDYADFSIGNFK